ncbi:MAG: hypothetical protein AB7O59_20330 [Pirellulales bacterium]
MRQVLAEMTGIGSARTAGQSSSGTLTQYRCDKTNRESTAADGELLITAKVISTRELEHKLKGVTRLVVTRGAVLTPSARDMLREHRISMATAVADESDARRR